MDFLAIEAGLIYGGGDPEWLLEQPREKRVQIMAYTLARKEAELGFWSGAGLQASDLVHLLSKITTATAKPKGGDLMDGLLGQLWTDPE